ncbi:MAG: rhomboid family intramembrane serine protease [Anaerolineae bacterium]|nr:rhomboid family intramembrane serine protease [Anaerolineae bacterium]MDW8102451.1 rhomboid family intramembrane serine protease [Anaerolineae bacterium]
MIPLADDIPSRRLPVITYLIIAINILVFFFELSLGRYLDRFIAIFGLTPWYIVNWSSYPFVFITVFTSMFLHAGWIHLFGNMLYLWVFGDNVEDAMGHLRFLFFYLLSGCAAAFAQVLVNPLSKVPMIGASGAVAGVLGAYFLFYPRARVIMAVPFFFYLQMISVPALLVLGSWFLVQLLNGFATITASTAVTGGVAWWAHIGGFVAGLVLGPIFRRRRSEYHYDYEIWN